MVNWTTTKHPPLEKKKFTREPSSIIQMIEYRRPSKVPLSYLLYCFLPGPLWLMWQWPYLWFPTTSTTAIHCPDSWFCTATQSPKPLCLFICPWKDVGKKNCFGCFGPQLLEKQQLFKESDFDIQWQSEISSFGRTFIAKSIKEDHNYQWTQSSQSVLKFFSSPETISLVYFWQKI